MNKSSVYVFLSACLFSIGGLLFKIITWDALAISSARSIISFIALFIYLKATHHDFVINKTVLIAAASNAITGTFYSLANKLTTAGNTIVLQFTMPIFVILIMLIFYHKKPSKRDVMACLFVFIGIVFFFIDSVSSGSVAGNICALISGFAYAGVFVFNSREDSEPLSSIMLAYVISAAIGLPSLIRTDISGSSPEVLLAVLALGLFQQALAQICFSKGVKATPVITSSLISGVEPILNPILVAIFYHEYLTPLSLIGAAIVLITIVLYNYLEAIKGKYTKI